MKDIGDPIPLAYGRSRIEPFLIDRFLIGSLRQTTRDAGAVGAMYAISGYTDSHLYLLLGFCLGEIDGFDYLLLDNERHTITRFQGVLWWKGVTGTRDQTAMTAYYQNRPPIAINPTDPAGADATYRGRDIAMVTLVAFAANLNPAFDEQPEVEAVVRGRLVYDPRQSAQSVPDGNATSSTAKGWQFSANPALCLLDYLTNPFGLNAPLSSIDLPSFIDAANACDELVPIPHRTSATQSITVYDPETGLLQTIATGDPISSYRPWQVGTTQPRYEFNGNFPSDMDYKEAIKLFLKTMSGNLFYFNGKFVLYLDRPRSATDLIIDKSKIGYALTYKKKSRGEKYNQATVEFMNRSLEYKKDNALWPGAGDTNLTAFDAVDGERRKKSEKIPACIDSYRAIDLAEHLVRLSRLDKIVEFDLQSIECLLLQPGDLIELRHPSLFAVPTPALFRVETIRINPNAGLTGRVTARIEDATAYSWSNKPAESLLAIGEAASLYDYSNAAIAGLSVGYTYNENADGTLIPAINVSWDAVVKRDKGYVVFLIDPDAPINNDLFSQGGVIDEIDVIATACQFRGVKVPKDYLVAVLYHTTLGGLAGLAIEEITVPGLLPDGSAPTPPASNSIFNVPLAAPITAIIHSRQRVGYFGDLIFPSIQISGGRQLNSTDNAQNMTYEAISGSYQEVVRSAPSPAFAQFLSDRDGDLFQISISFIAAAAAADYSIDNLTPLSAYTRTQWEVAYDAPPPLSGNPIHSANFAAYDSASSRGAYALEYRATSSSDWIRIAQASIALSGTRQNFQTAESLPSSIYEMRLLMRRPSASSSREERQRTRSFTWKGPGSWSAWEWVRYENAYPPRINLSGLDVRYSAL